MIDPKQIPDEVVEAAARAIFDASPFREEEAPLHEQSAQYQALTRTYATAAIRAALAAWPGVQIAGGFILDKTFHDIILPLPQEGER